MGGFPFYRYYTPESLGFDNTSSTLSTLDLISVLPEYATVESWLNDTTCPAIFTEITSAIGKSAYGVLKIEHYGTSVWTLNYYHYNSSETWTQRYTTINSQGFSDWKRIDNV